jgi:hypothetical protein
VVCMHCAVPGLSEHRQKALRSPRVWAADCQHHMTLPKELSAFRNAVSCAVAASSCNGSRAACHHVYALMCARMSIGPPPWPFDSVTLGEQERGRQSIALHILLCSGSFVWQLRCCESVHSNHCACETAAVLELRICCSSTIGSALAQLNCSMTSDVPLHVAAQSRTLVSVPRCGFCGAALSTAQHAAQWSCDLMLLTT